MNSLHPPRGVRFAISLVAVLFGTYEASAQLQEGALPPHWIWHPGRPAGAAPAETVYLRKPFQVKENGSRLTLDVTADNRFVLYLDGKEVAKGDDWKNVRSVDARINAGNHVLAAKVTNDEAGPAGFLVRGSLSPLGQVAPVHTDDTWKAAEKVADGDAWTKPDFDDARWVRAADLGVIGISPWKGLVFESGDASQLYKVPKGFQVSLVAPNALTGSAIAFAFDPEGRPCVSVERGPIVRLLDEDKDGQSDGRLVIAPQMKNCQGFSFIRGALYAVGEGPEKTGIYRLTDGNNDGVFETAKLIRGSTSVVQEHGPHTVMLGPDGSLYFNNGNHAHLQEPIDPASPVDDAFKYEGELLPHYNDARGHAVGVLAPGGEIYRSDDDGKTWERIVGGFRNEYDFAFNRDGEILSFDSDMEWDIGLPWYRPVRVNHSIPGAELGWRNGSATWPAYFFDSLPATHDVGRGSPTGVTFYQGKKFPKELDDNFLISDWSQGRILAISLERFGATYKAKETELVSGQPLNVTDLEVGPDGALYFTTGGRGTLGGLYRVEWVASETPKLIKPEEGKPDLLRDALEMDSPLSAYGQRRLAQIKAGMEESWGAKLVATASDDKASAFHRTRALDLLAQLGPRPSEELLTSLAKDADAAVRSKAVFLLGTRATDTARAAVASTLGDSDPFVRRHACEALVRQKGAIPVEKVAPLLDDTDRWVRYAARVAIEHGDVSKLRGDFLSNAKTRPQLEAMLAIVRATKLDKAIQDDLLDRQIKLLDEALTAESLIDLYRLINLTYILGPQKAAEAPASVRLRSKLLGLGYPTSKAPEVGSALVILNRENARLLAYLNEPKAIARLLDAQAGDPDHATQTHYTYCLRNIKEGWTDEDKRRLWAWYETASHWEGGFSYLGYLDFMCQDLVALLSPKERTVLLDQGEKYPFPTRVLVRSLDLNTQPTRITDLAALYARLESATNIGAANELRNLILEILGRSPDSKAHDALRATAKSDPPRRDLIARALASHPEPADLPVLVAALDSRDANTTNTVLAALLRLDARPEGPEGMRNLLRLARRTGPPITQNLNTLASRWMGPKISIPGFISNYDLALRFWEDLYRQRFKDAPSLADDGAGQNSYTYTQLISEILQAGRLKKASPERGKVVIARAKCLDCHKLGDQGAGLGPDLTTVWSRFRPGEIIESIVDPSKVISDQYKSVSLATTDGKLYNGMPTGSDVKALILLLSDGTKVTIPKEEIEEQKESKISVMPEGLMNALTLEEIADLLALFESQPRVEVSKDAPKP